MTASAETLRASLTYEPQQLSFGTSGRRGEVVHLTQLEIYINALAELLYLQSISASEGGIVKGEEFYFAYDLRPSSTHYVPQEQGRGELCQAVELAIQHSGMRPVNLGFIPTPALTHYALLQGKGSIMVTGSHIPFSRNGYKTNTSKGELLKHHEAPISRRVEEIRKQLYSQSVADSLFDAKGLLKRGSRSLSPQTSIAESAYLQRYLDFFAGQSLKGKKIVVYQHSAVGRDLLVRLLEQLGAEVVPCGRSETFVPIDTENIDKEQLATIQHLANEVEGPIFAVVSTDGDSDRPLLLGIDPQTEKVRFVGGDVVGMIVAEYLGTDAVVVPISCNDAVDQGKLASVLQPKTQIGSPYVIAGMEKAKLQGKEKICGWEANGGFLTGSDIQKNGATLAALPTRDAILPILSVLFRAAEEGLSLLDVFARLPKRFSRAALLKQFPNSIGRKIVATFSPADSKVKDVLFAAQETTLLDGEGGLIQNTAVLLNEIDQIRNGLTIFFPSEKGFTPIAGLNYIDGVRVTFSNGDVAHIRPSGNADELRIYAVADTEARAEDIVGMGVSEPDGILRRIEKAVTQ